MSLYNMLNGVSPVTFYVLPVLGKHPEAYARFRDAFVGDEERPDTEGKLIVYTRLGGGNRDDYEDDIEEIRAMDGFLYDYDDDFDCTYANFVFDIPERWAPDVALVLAGKSHEVSDGYVDLVTGIYPKIAEKLREALRPASVDRSGEADETSTKIEGSAEGESAVTPKAADAQTSCEGPSS